MNKKEQLLLEQLKIASELHRHMDDMIWRRFDYFIALNGLLLSALTVIWFSRADKTPLGLGLAITAVIALFGGFVSFTWSKIQKRAQLYHRLRTTQARTAERALIESVLNHADMTEDQWVLQIYVQRLLEQCKDIEQYNDVWKVCCSRCGMTSTNDLVFTLSMILSALWVIILVSVLVVSTLIAKQVVPLTFISPISSP
jgi:hypothetical protein